MKERVREAALPRITPVADDGAERPQRPPVAVLRAAVLGPLARVREKVPEATSPRIEGVVDEGEKARRQRADPPSVVGPPASSSVVSSRARALSSRQ